MKKPAHQSNATNQKRRLSIIGTIFAAGVASIALATVLSPSEATAKAQLESGYGFERTWNAAIRLVRVDMGLKITEKDDNIGYLLFEYRSAESGGKVSPGSFEFIRGKEPNTPVHVVVQLPQMPHYHEQLLMDGLSKKLRQEYGDPPAQPSPPRSPSVDAGADAEADAESWW